MSNELRTPKSKDEIITLLKECLHQMELLNENLKKLYNIEDQEN